MAEQSLVVAINQEINRELADPAVVKALLSTTFKGLDAVKMKQAIMEGMIRGFTFENFLKKDVYSLPFGSTYSLVTSIDNSRKIAMRTGLYCGKSAPTYEIETGEDGVPKIISCTVTVKKLTAGVVGEFTATVFFDEYTKKRDLWISKPKTMIAKVAEMHALRMAFPEEMAKTYIEEEITPSRMSGAETTVEESGLTMGSFKKSPNEKNNQGAEDETKVIADADSQAPHGNQG